MSLLCILDISSSTHLDLGSYSRHYSPVAMVMHHNRCKELPELPTEVLPAAQHPDQHRNMFQFCVFKEETSAENPKNMQRKTQDVLSCCSRLLA